MKIELKTLKVGLPSFLTTPSRLVWVIAFVTARRITCSLRGVLFGCVQCSSRILLKGRLTKLKFFTDRNLICGHGIWMYWRNWSRFSINAADWASSCINLVDIRLKIGWSLEWCVQDIHFWLKCASANRCGQPNYKYWQLNRPGM